MPVELEAAEGLVALHHLALALQHVDLDAGLAVRRGGEDLALLRRDGRVALDELREHAADGLDAERKRGDVEKQDVLDFAAEHAALNGGADGDAFVGVDALERVFAGDFLDHILHERDTGGAADEEDLVKLRGGEAGVAEAFCMSGLWSSPRGR